MTLTDAALLLIVCALLALVILAMSVQSRMMDTLTQHKREADRIFALIDKQSVALTWSSDGCKDAISKLDCKMDELGRKFDALAGRGV